MDNRSFASASSASPPSAPASPSVGYPTNGNPSLAIPATIPGDYWFYQIGEELRALIVAGGLTPAAGTLNQLASAIFGTKSLAANGYQKLPGGLIIQWGQFNITVAAGNYTQSVTFPIAFPNSCLQVFPAGHYTNGDSSAVADNFNSSTYARSATGASFTYECINSQNTGSTLEWFAIGY